MERKSEENNLWKSCKGIFIGTSNNNLEELLERLIEFVKRNNDILVMVADEKFLQYIMSIKADMFVIGTCGDNFENTVNIYAKKNDVSNYEVWKMISNLIWDLTTFTTSEVCPYCHSDHLRILTDGKGEKIYKSCDTCFAIEEQGQSIPRPKEIFPADKKILYKLKYYN